jgi:hypothetical protein
LGLPVPFLPSTFTERMGTIKTYKATFRLHARRGVEMDDGLRQGPSDGRRLRGVSQNQIRYEKVEVDRGQGDGQRSSRSIAPSRQGARLSQRLFRDARRAGLFRAGLVAVDQRWLGMFRMEVLRQRYRKAEPGQDGWIAPLAVALQSAQIVYMLGAAFIAIAFQPFVFMLIGAQIGLDTYMARKREESAWRPLRKARPALA